MNADKIATVLAAHRLWLGGDSKGVRADLTGANLTRANLTRAKIAEGTIASFVFMTGLRWPVLVFFLVRSSAILQIGCERHATEEWAGFTDERIASMGNYALEFWREWRGPLLALAKHEAGRAGI